MRLVEWLEEISKLAVNTCKLKLFPVLWEYVEQIENHRSVVCLLSKKLIHTYAQDGAFCVESLSDDLAVPSSEWSNLLISV